MAASSSRKSRSKSSAKAGAKASRGATKAQPVKAPQGKKRGKQKGEKVTLLSGGNPQIAKGDGDAPVQAYIAAMPGWKRDVGRRLDALIVRSVPNVRKAVEDTRGEVLGYKGEILPVFYHACCGGHTESAAC